MYYRIFSYLVVLFVFCTAELRGQASDSLKATLASATHDSTRCKLLVKLIEEEENEEVWSKYNQQLKNITEKNLATITRDDPMHRFYTNYYAQVYNNMGYLAFQVSQFAKAKAYMQKGLGLQQQIADSEGVASSLCNLGAVYDSQGEYNEAMEYNREALKMQVALGERQGQASILNNMAAIYTKLGDIPKSIDYLSKSIKIQEELDDKTGLASSLNNLGVIYKGQGDDKRAEELYRRGLKLHEETGSKGGQANFLAKIGLLYAEKKDTAEALAWFRKALAIQEERDDKTSIADVLIDIGDVYKDQAPSRALQLFQRSLNLYRESGYREGEALALTKVANAYFLSGETKRALTSGLSSLELSRQLPYPENIRNAAAVLKRIYVQLDQPREALEMFELYIRMRDSLSNEEKRKIVLKSEFKYEFEKKEALLVQQQEKARLLAEEKQQRQRFMIWSALFVLLLVAIFAVLIYKRLKITRRQNVIIEKQKGEVEEHRKEILDSINYARRIQFALLASDTLLRKNLPGHFVLFLPKAVVSGDFYWATPTSDGFIYVTADCTGHGVPGAFMSLLIISKLSRIINEKMITRPDLILNEVRDEIIKVLNPDGSENEAKDGMDAVVCRLNTEKMTLEFAAANNPFLVVRDGMVLPCKADRMPVGKGHNDNTPFTYNQIALQKGDRIYTFSDGLADQFGGPRGKKFKYKQLESVLLANSGLSMELQREKLLEVFESWKGSFEQVDDVCVIGVSV
jgi:serine phosphatase RsbU (regulator of sigma subunit)/Tfp pilus assembly protein PilF